MKSFLRAVQNGGGTAAKPAAKTKTAAQKRAAAPGGAKMSKAGKYGKAIKKLAPKKRR